VYVLFVKGKISAICFVICVIAFFILIGESLLKSLCVIFQSLTLMCINAHFFSGLLVTFLHAISVALEMPLIVFP